MSQDRIERDDLPLTHNFLSMMLGVRRTGVTVAAQEFQKGGLIQYDRGNITVLNRPVLEVVSCECHQAYRREHERLISTTENRAADRLSKKRVVEYRLVPTVYLGLRQGGSVNGAQREEGE
jgi:hypothetical protein